MSADQLALPGMPATTPRPEAEPALSYGRRLTIRQHTAVAAGRHPLTGGTARPDLGTCGTCGHRTSGRGDHAGTYPKCDLGPQTRSAATDVRGWWPACDRWARS